MSGELYYGKSYGIIVNLFKYQKLCHQGKFANRRIDNLLLKDNIGFTY